MYDYELERSIASCRPIEFSNVRWESKAIDFLHSHRSPGKGSLAFNALTPQNESQCESSRFCPKWWACRFANSAGAIGTGDSNELSDVVDRVRRRQLGHRLSTQTVTVDFRGQVRGNCVSGPPGEVAKDAGTWWCLLGGDVPSLVLHFQVPVQALKYIYDCTGVARPVRSGQQLQSTPAISDSVVPGDSASVIEAQHLLQVDSVHWSIGGFRLLGRHLEAAVEAWKKVLQHTICIIDGDCPASRISVTSLSWKVPAVRSTRPLACGDRANISCMPSSSIARLN